jgi:hypothetical protein
VATIDGLLRVSPDFSSHSLLAYDYDRVSGVAVGGDGHIYTTDQIDNRLVILNADGSFNRSFFIGPVPTGLDFDQGGVLYAAIFSDQSLRRVDLNSDSSTTVLSGIQEISDIAFSADGSYYLSMARGNILQHRSITHSLLESVGTQNFADSIAIMPVPEPSTCVLATQGLLAVVLNLRRRRMSEAF